MGLLRFLLYSFRIPSLPVGLGYPMLGMAVVWLCFYPWLPLFRDQAIFAYLGMVIADGGIPYRDAWEVKGPLAHYLYALPVALGGTGSVAGIRTLDISMVALGLWSLHRLLRHMALEQWWPLIAGMSIFLWTGSFASSAQPDGWVGILLLCVLAVLFEEGGAPRSRTALLCGALVGLAFWIKPVHGVFLALPTIHCLAFRVGTKDGIRFTCMATGSFAAVLGAGVAWFAAHGALPDLYDAMVVFNLKAHAPVASAPLLAAVGEPFLLLVAACSVPWFSRHRRREGIVLVLVYGLGMAVMLIQRKYFHYQGFPMYAVLLVAMAPAFASLSESSANLTLGQWVKAFVGIRKFCVIVGMTFLTMFWLFSASSSALQIATGERRFSLTDYRAEEIARIADFIRGHTAETDTVLTVGLDTGINYFAGRHSPTRIWFYALLVGRGDLLARHRDEASNAILAAPPAMVALNTKAANALFHGNGDQFLRLYSPAIETLLRKNYDEVFSTEHWSVYAHRNQLKER